MPYVRRDDLGLYYERAGDGDPALLFVHGWCCDHSFFAPQVDHFGAAHTVVTTDLRGCGRSDRPADGYDVTTFADDLAWLCGEIDVPTPVVVVGHSLGGMIAIELAARYPALCRAVIAVDPGPINPTTQERLVYDGFAEQMRGPAGEAVRRTWVDDTVGVTDDPVRDAWIVQTMCSVPLTVAADVIGLLSTWNGVAALAMSTAPMLVLRPSVTGSNDPTRLLSIRPDVHIGVTVGAGHFHQLEVPDQVTAMMQRFLDQCSRRESNPR